MGKMYSHKTYVSHKNFILMHETQDEQKIEYYYPWVITIANTFPREAMAIGTLDINDLIQAGNIGLIEAWRKVDWDRIKDSKNSQGELWSFLKIRIKYAIRQEIDAAANIIKIPDREIRDARSKLRPLNKILVNVFPNFFDRELWVEKVVDPYLSIQLEVLIDDQLELLVHNVDHRDIIKKFYGIGFVKLSMQLLSEKYRKNTNAIGQIIHTVKKKLKNNEFEKIIENFYENR